jgi:hypothetical protein
MTLLWSDGLLQTTPPKAVLLYSVVRILSLAYE